MAEIKLNTPDGNNHVGVNTANTSGDITVTLPKASIDLSSAGNDGQFLKTDGAGTLSFATPTDTTTPADNTVGAGKTDLDIVAGDIIYGTGTNAWARLAKGSNDEVLTLASGVPSWAAAGGGLDGVTTGSGNVTITDGNLIVASGHGIDFSATSDGSGTDSSELMDDYEEGTFTPYFHLGSSPGAVTDSSKYLQQDGRYTKIGRFVSATFAVQGKHPDSAFDNWSSGDGFIKGWPYPFMGSQPQQVAFCRVHGGAGSWGTTYAPYVIYENYSDKAHLQAYNSGGVEPPGNVGNAFGFWGSLQYHTT